MSNPWDNIPLYNGPLRVTESAGSTDNDLWAFRRLTGMDRPDDLDETTYNRYQKLASWLYYQNPLARRLCDVLTDMALGGGISVEVDEQSAKTDANAEKVDECIKRFLGNPANEFQLRLPGMYTKLAAVNGELFIPVFVAPQNGDAVLGLLENSMVREVRFNPSNPMEAIGVVQSPPKASEPPIWWNVIRATYGENGVEYPPHPIFDDEEKVDVKRTPDGYQYGGELFYFRTNVLGEGRGRSALEPALDWLHAYDNFLFGDLRNANLQAAFVWDVKITGATHSDLTLRAEDIKKNPPRPGEVNFHNETEEWQALSPNLNAGDHSVLGLQVKKLIGMAMGLPSHLIGAEDQTNRTTSVSSDVPFLRRMEQRQRLLSCMVSTILDYQLHQKRHAQILKWDDKPFPYRIVLPSLNAVEMVGQAEALYNITQALLDATKSKFTSLAEARRVWYSYGLSESDVPDNIEEQINTEIKSGMLADEVANAKTELEAKTKPSDNGSVAKRGLRAKSVSGR
jgi:hypothetical protein